ncbi:MAG: hypothetical protein V7603_1391 [Micromonosporaceae bacterium]
MRQHAVDQMLRGSDPATLHELDGAAQSASGQRVAERILAAPDRAPARSLARPRRLVLAAGLAAVAGVAALVLVPGGSAPPGRQHPGDSPAMRLAAAAEATAQTSFRFSVSSSLPPPQVAVEKGAWDPAGRKGYMFFYDGGGRLTTEWRMIGTDLWTIDRKRMPPRVDHILVAPRQAALGIPHVQTLYLYGQQVAQTVNPRELLNALLASDASVTDLGTSGHGTGAVHTYGFTVKLYPYCGVRVPVSRSGVPAAIEPLPTPSGCQRRVSLETGTVVVGVTGKISKMTWALDLHEPDPPYTKHRYTWVVEYSGYGEPVDVQRP